MGEIQASVLKREDRLRSYFASLFLASFLLITILSLSKVAEAKLPPIIGVIRCDTVQTLFGYQIVPLGDQNSDGFADFLIWDFRNTGFICYGGNPVPTTPARRIHLLKNFISNVGDINGDGIDDIAGRQSKLRIFRGGHGLDTVPSEVFGLDTAFPVGYTVSDPDLLCPNKIALLSHGYDSKTVQLYQVYPLDSIPLLTLRPWWFSHPGFVFGEALAVGDFNGDGKRDVVMNLRPDVQYNTKSQVCVYWGGCSFDTVPDLVFTQPGSVDVGKVEFGKVIQNIGDVNGDGFDDLFVGHWESQDSTGLIYFGGPTFDSIPDLTITDTPTRAKRAGDLNGDGLADFITSYPLESSSFSYVDIFYGRPHVDSIPDFRINVWEMPEYLILFGMDIAGLGDVNGDGINDFAVSAVDGGGHGVVYIFSGDKSGVGVDSGDGSNLPKGFTLDPAYPNPFNGSTTIAFELPRAGHVTIAIYDISGHQINTLLDRRCGSGVHRVKWDGSFYKKSPSASGVYFCRALFEGQQFVQKLLLLK